MTDDKDYETNRLSFEIDYRKKLLVQIEDKQKELENLKKSKSILSESMVKLPNVLKSLKTASKELELAFGLNLSGNYEIHKGALTLPDTLYALFMQLDIFKQFELSIEKSKVVLKLPNCSKIEIKFGFSNGKLTVESKPDKNILAFLISNEEDESFSWALKLAGVSLIHKNRKLNIIQKMTTKDILQRLLERLQTVSNINSK